MEQKLEMFRNIIDANNDASSDLEFAENLNSEFLTNLIYCFTPKGDVVELPEGATPIDFAYRIHSKVGDTTIGAIVNDVIVPLDYNLKDGDIIKINTSSNGTPHKEWLNFVKTSQAKSKIKAFFSKQDRANYITKGQSILEKEIRRKKLALNEVLNDTNLKKVFTDLKISDIEELYLAIGSLRYTPSYIINLINEDKKDVQDILLEKVLNGSRSKLEQNKNDIIVAGIDDVLINIAKCCKPIKGDKIKGYITKGQGITVHKDDCPNILDGKRTIDVSWNENTDNRYLTDLEIVTQNGKNFLLDIITKATQRNIYIESVNTKEQETTIIYLLTVKTKNKEELDLFINDVYSLPLVNKVNRKIK